MSLPAKFRFSPTRIGICAVHAGCALVFSGALSAAAVGDTLQRTRPDPLVQIDLNRAAVVERIVAAWGAEVPSAQIASFKGKLMGLRADQLFAANISGTFEAVLEIVYANERGTRATSGADRAKALGESERDLVYTPVTPCRLFDTRLALGQLAPGVQRNLQVIAADFADQGGAANNCNVDLGAKAAVINIAVVNATGAGHLTVWPSGTTIPLASSLNFAPGQTQVAEANAIIMPLCTSSCPANSEISAQSTHNTDLIGDIVGYFMPPNRTGDGLRVTNVNNVSPNVINGSAANAHDAGVRGATISGGGVTALADPDYGGDAPNRVTDHYGTIGGGMANVVGDSDADVSDAAFATISGGRGNTAIGSLTTIAGGLDNVASGYISSIGGGEFNDASDAWTFIGGGRFNRASGSQSAVGGGGSNTASGPAATVAGGLNNAAAGLQSAVGGGTTNTASGERSTVGGGFNNNASGNFALVIGGRFNTASGTGSAALGGDSNSASGIYAFAAGRGATTETVAAQNQPAVPHHGTFVWADTPDPLAPLPTRFHSSTNNQFAVRSRGGVVFKLDAAEQAGDATPGCSLPAGGAASWSCSSDRNLKEAVKSISPRDVLNKVISMPMSSWQFKGSANRHISPMAQDFWKAFGLGTDDRHITSSDVSGVALAAIQGMNQKLLADGKAKDAKISALEKANAVMHSELAAIKRKLGL